MTLTKEQQRDLALLSEYFKEIEKVAIENNIDLDVFMSDYNEDGFAIYATERLGRQMSKKRKSVFEKAEKEKSKSSTKNN